MAALRTHAARMQRPGHCRGENVCPVGWDPMSWSQAIMITDIRHAPDYLLSSCTLLPTLGW